ncbi:MAG: hypothetical protein QXF82_02960 [Nitrososphaeria archaeon]
MKKGVKKLMAMVMSLVAALSLTVGVAFASEPTGTDLEPIKTALQSAFTVGEIASVIGIVIATGVSFVLLWWGARKLVNAIIGAFKTGKLRF